MLHWIESILLFAAIIMYFIVAFNSIKYLVGFMSGEQLRQKAYPMVIVGMVLMIATTGIKVAFRVSAGQPWLDPMLALNAFDILMNAAVLHTIYRQWSYQWTAGLSIATLFLDGNLRFLLLYLFS